MRYIEQETVVRRMNGRMIINRLFQGLFLFATLLALLALVILLYRIVTQGAGHLSLDFLSNFASRFPEKAGIKAALVGSIWLMAVVAPTSIILGVGSAIYLEEYAKKGRITTFIQMNISNLAGVPSVVSACSG